MRLILINSLGPMGSSVVAAIVEKFGYINLPLRKRKLNEYVLGSKKIDDNYFKDRTKVIINGLSSDMQLGGTGVLDRDSSLSMKRFDMNLAINEVDAFYKKKFININDLYFASMKLANNITAYKEKVRDIKGAIELSVDIEKYKPDLLHSSYLKCFKDIKIINLTRDFDSWLNSLCSQNFSQDKILRYLKFNISNYKKIYLKYLNSIKYFKGLNIDFSDIFIPNTDRVIKRIKVFLEESNNNIVLENLKNQNYDLYGGIRSYNKTFNVVDDKQSYLSKLTRGTLKKFIYLKYNSILIDIFFIVIFQFLYILDFVRFKKKKVNE